ADSRADKSVFVRGNCSKVTLSGEYADLDARLCFKIYTSGRMSAGSIRSIVGSKVRHLSALLLQLSLAGLTSGERAAIHAEGEYVAAEKLAMAAELIQRQPIAIQLRYLQTLVEIGTEKNTTVVFPLPIDMISAF